MAGGRPTKYSKAMAQRVIEMMSEGASLAEVAADIGVSRETMNRWSKDDQKPEFCDAIKKGIELSEAWWEHEGRVSLRDNRFNHVLWYMNMKNRFGWRDKNEVTGRDGEPLAVRIIDDIS